MSKQNGTLTFGVSGERFAADTLGRLHRYHRFVSLELFTAVSEASPVGNPSIWKDKKAAAHAVKMGYVGGRFRANWICSTERPEVAIEEGRDYSGRETKNAQTVLGANPGQSIMLTNSMPYGYRLEFKGWSSQAPHGMLRRQFARITQIAADNLRRAKNGTGPPI